MPGDVTFLLVSAAEAALKELDDPRRTELHDIDAVPIHLWIPRLSQRLVEFM